MRKPPAGEAYADRLARLSQSGRGLGEYVPFVGVMPAAIPEGREEFDLEAGAIVLATGFRPYQPRPGEYGYREFPEVVTLPEFIRQMAEAEGRRHPGAQRPPHPPAALIHCVGSRQIPGIHAENEGGYLNEYCSRTCCSATLYAANQIRDNIPRPGFSIFTGTSAPMAGARRNFTPRRPQTGSVFPLRGRGGAAGRKESRPPGAPCWSG